MNIILITFFYFLCGFITFRSLKSCETEEFAEVRRIWRILIRISYILFWPIYFIGTLLWDFIEMLIE